MGCASSKSVRRQGSPDGSASPLPRSRSLPIPHSSLTKADRYDHGVSLNSTTLGSLKLDPLHEKSYLDQSREEEEVEEAMAKEAEEEPMRTRKVFAATKVTPTATPPGEPETMNVWEIMEGLEEHSPLYLPRYHNCAIGRSFSFHAVLSKTAPPAGRSPASPSPVWFQVDDSDPYVLADFDPDIIDNFRKALNALSPSENSVVLAIESVGKQNKSDVTEKHESETNPVHNNGMTKKAASKVVPLNACPPFGEDRVVLYVTSLRGIRKTYEDCCATRLIFKGFGLLVDERDVSMHSAFKDELRDILGESGAFPLPRVFIRGQYIGGADEVRQMHDAGELGALLEGLPAEEAVGSACDGCGDVRFVPCETCHGSCKVYEEDDGGFIRCSDCNENGIVRCSFCC